jgi:hypothetical protein
LIQQFLALGIVVRSLESIPALRERKAVVVVLGAALFGLVHAYDATLAVCTFALEALLILVYFRHRNLWAIGVLHGWLGGALLSMGFEP